MISVVGLWCHRWMALDRLGFLGVDGRWSCMLNVKGLVLFAAVVSRISMCVVQCTCSLLVQPWIWKEQWSYQYTDHSHCTAMCVLSVCQGWCHQFGEGLWLDRFLCWLWPLTDLFLSTVYINISNMKTMFTYSLFLAANLFFYTGCTCFCVFGWYTLRY